jgi:hypothetical protein
MTVTVGNDTNHLFNPECLAPDSILDTGWYFCKTTLTGQYFTLFSRLSRIAFATEVMAYSEEAIHLNSLITWDN